MNVLDKEYNLEKQELLFGPSLDADWFDENNLRQLNFPILQKHEAGTSSDIDDEDDVEEEWEEEFDAEDDMEGESDAED